MPDIATEKVCQIVVLARQLEAEDEGIGADASNPTDDGFVAAITEDAYASVRAEARAFIAAMDEDEQTELVALAWVGRGDFDAREWADALRLAREQREGPTDKYLLGMPLLAAYLEAGLDAFGESCADFEADRQ